MHDPSHIRWRHAASPGSPSVDGPVLRDGFAAIRTELHVPTAFPPDVLAAAAAGRSPVEPGDVNGAGPDRRPVSDDRSTWIDGPRPGHAHRRATALATGCVRDRRRRGVRVARRSDRCRGARARRDALQPRHADAAASAGDRRRRREPAARPDQAGPRLDHRPRCRRAADRGRRQARGRAVGVAAQLQPGPAADRREPARAQRMARWRCSPR